MNLRDDRDTEQAFPDELNSPEVGGGWHSFDDPPDQILRGANFGGSGHVVEFEDGS